MNKFHYVLEDASGNTTQYSFDVEGNTAALEAMVSKMRDINGCKLHIYRHYKTIGEQNTMTTYKALPDEVKEVMCWMNHKDRAVIHAHIAALEAEVKHLRKPAMTEAELVQEAECLASDFSAGSYDESCWGAKIFDLAKKYRGMLYD